MGHPGHVFGYGGCSCLFIGADLPLLLFPFLLPPLLFLQPIWLLVCLSAAFLPTIFFAMAGFPAIITLPLSVVALSTIALFGGEGRIFLFLFRGFPNVSAVIFIRECLHQFISCQKRSHDTRR